MFDRPVVKEGALWVGRKPVFLLAGEYPYYRDTPSLWPQKLHALKRAGLNTVSFYIPWRHHELEDGTTIFDGDGNRNLFRFLRDIADAGLYAFGKPGPFVHAELPLGGLPNRVSPHYSQDRIAALSASGEPLRINGLTLPSAHDPVFLKDAHNWLRKVGRALERFQFPDGPLIAVQIGNEGYYCDSPLPIDALDYSEPAAAAFITATGFQPPRRWSQPRSATDLLPFIAWGNWIARSLNEGMIALSSALGLGVPSFCNYAPPKGGDFDVWYLKVEKRPDSQIAYGYTSWVGNIRRDDDSFIRYMLAASVNRGPNLEENWSLDWVDPECHDATVPIYHAMLGIACGATGINVYTACATDKWDEGLNIEGLDRPYGAAAPIGVNGEFREKAHALAVFTHFLRGVSKGLLRTIPVRDVIIAADTTTAAIGAWRPRNSNCKDGFPIPQSMTERLSSFALDCLSRNSAFAIRDLSDTLPKGPVVVMGGPFCPEQVQRDLAERIERDNSVTFLSRKPEWDQHFQRCTALADSHVSISESPSSQEILNEYLVLRLCSEDECDRFLFFFSRTDKAVEVSASEGDLVIRCKLNPRCCAAVRLTDNQLSAFFVIGSPIALKAGKDSFESNDHDSVSAVRRGNTFDIRTHRRESEPAVGPQSV